MKISVLWLQRYFEKPLPSAEKLAEALTFHAFEIESVDIVSPQDAVLDVKVLPNRAADCLSHRGIAKELSAILNVPLKSDPFRDFLPMNDLRGRSLGISVEIADSTKCLRFVGAVIKGVKVGPSPAWLKDALESVGQRSINNIVDATNYVMLDIGQPMHAFDSGKLKSENGNLKIKVRDAKKGEKITVLSGEEYALPEGAILITDGNADAAIGIAGIKGGKPASITEDTKDIIVEAANFDGTTIRKTAQALKLFTDASQRFQNNPSPELPAYAMRDVLKIIADIASGELVGVVDVYPQRPVHKAVSVTAETISKRIGAEYSDDDLAGVFKRLDLAFTKEAGVFTVTPPFERTDIVIPEDLAEEVGRIMGYENVASAELAPATGTPDQNRFRGIERMKDMLVEKGFIEVSTQSFAPKGDVILANPLDKTKPALRPFLKENLAEALERAKLSAPLVLAPNEKPKLFEVGSVFSKEGEYLALEMTERVPELGFFGVPAQSIGIEEQEELGKEDFELKRYSLGPYKPFSIYPFVLRDIALWVPSGTDVGFTKPYIEREAGELLFRCDLFDTFEKDGKVSYAFRLVFQSMERTLSDAEVNAIMEKVTSALNAQEGWQVR